MHQRSAHGHIVVRHGPQGSGSHNSFLHDDSMSPSPAYVNGIDGPAGYIPICVLFICFDSQFSRGPSGLNDRTAPPLDIIGHQTFIILIMHDRLSYRAIAHVSNAALFHVYAQNLEKVNPFAYCKCPTSGNQKYIRIIDVIIPLS